MNFRWIPEKNDSGQIFSSLRYEFIDGFTAGLDYRPLVDDFALAAITELFPKIADGSPLLSLAHPMTSLMMFRANPIMERLVNHQEKLVISISHLT